MSNARRVTHLVLAVLLALTLLAPAAAAAPPVTQDDTAGPAGWWSWLTEPVMQVVGALGVDWDATGVIGDGGTETVTADGGDGLEAEDPGFEDGGNLGPGWEPQG